MPIKMLFRRSDDGFSCLMSINLTAFKSPREIESIQNKPMYCTICPGRVRSEKGTRIHQPTLGPDSSTPQRYKFVCIAMQFKQHC